MIDENWILPFGKYKGQKLESVPYSYLVWLYDNKQATGELKKWIENNVPLIQAQIRAQNKK